VYKLIINKYVLYTRILGKNDANHSYPFVSLASECLQV